MYTIVIYTASSVMEFDVRYDGLDLAEAINKAIDNGMIMLETVKGNNLIINPLEVVAIEISTPHIEDK